MKELPQLAWTPELASRFWSDLAGTEFQLQTAFARWASPELVTLVAQHLARGSRVLDFGSGYGLFLVRELLCRGYSVAFFEPSFPADAQRPDFEGEPNFLGPVRTLEEEAYDAAFCSEVIEHLEDTDLDAALLFLRASLKQGGTLIVTTPENENLFLASRYCPTCRQLFHPWGHVRNFSSNDLEVLLKKHGFEVAELHSVDFSSYRGPIEELKSLKRFLAAFLTDCEEAADALLDTSVGAVLHASTASRLKRYLAELGKYREPSPTIDPHRQHIGAGGTLVAIAKKTETP